jgi:chemotaxis signal transduction protein
MELLLFRLGDRGYASPRERVREVVDVGAGRPAMPGLSASSLGGLGGGQRPIALVSLGVTLGLPDLGPEGRILVVTTRTGPVGFQAHGSSWLLIDWDAIRLPTGITAPR